MPKYIKLSALGGLLAMSAGVVVAASLRDASDERVQAGPAAATSSPRGIGSPLPAGLASPHPSASSAGFAPPGAPTAVRVHQAQAPLPPSWQSLLPGAIRL